MKRLMGYLAAGILMFVFAGSAMAGMTERVSIDSYGNQGNGQTFGFDRLAVSDDGMHAVFYSASNNLVPGNTTGGIYVRDRQNAKTVRIDIYNDGSMPNTGGGAFSINANGRYIAFKTDAALVPGAPNYAVYIHDRDADGNGVYDEPGGFAVKIVSVGTNGTLNQGDSPSISADGRYVAFMSLAGIVPNDTNNAWDIYVHDRDANNNGIFDEPNGTSVNRVSVDDRGNQANNSSYYPMISANGRHIIFTSSASNLVSGDTNGNWDFFVHDMQTGKTVRVSVDSNGNQSYGDANCQPSISADGRYVAYYTYASNLVPGDSNNSRDVFLHDRDIDGNGIFDERGGISTERVSVDSNNNQGLDDSLAPYVSRDGRFVAFHSRAWNLVSGDTNATHDVFIRDRQNGITERVSVDSNGNQANGASFGVAINADARYVTFASSANNLVPDDTNGVYDAFVHDRINDNDIDGYRNYIDGDCNDFNAAIHPGATETKHDGIDQDCNGYDLTINITNAAYTASKDSLIVSATSVLGVAANLTLVGYGPMSYQGNQWKKTIQPAGGNPQIVTVSGVEGTESTYTTVK